MKEQRIVISLPENSLNWLGHQAARGRTSRKALMETILINHAESYRVTVEGKQVSKNQIKIK